MVRRLSCNNATAIGLSDRGRIAPGLRADINIVVTTYDASVAENTYDLPAGGKRLLQQATGIDATLVAGQVVWRDGEATAPCRADCCEADSQKDKAIRLASR